MVSFFRVGRSLVHTSWHPHQRAAAKDQHYLIDNYIMESHATSLGKKKRGVKAILLTKLATPKQLELISRKANEQYGECF